MTDRQLGYGKIDLGTSNKIRENEDCVLELVTAEGASSRFLLNEIVGRYIKVCSLFNCIIVLFSKMLSFSPGCPWNNLKNVKNTV